MRTPSLADRQRAAADAKKAALERYRGTLSDFGFAERRAVRRAIVAAREIRIAERRTAEDARRAQEAAEKAAREEAERAAREAAHRAELAARQAAAEAKAAGDRELEEAQLNTRKVRKAARKANRSGVGQGTFGYSERAERRQHAAPSASTGASSRIDTRLRRGAAAPRE